MKNARFLPLVAAGIVMMIALLVGCATPADPGPSPRTASSDTVPAPAESVGPTESTGENAVGAGSPPIRIEIAAIGVDSGVMGLGLRADGTMEVPPGGFPAGWYTGSPIPGSLGPSILAGHVDWGGSAGVFYRLGELNKGDAVVVTSSDGQQVRFDVTAVEQYPKNEFPTQSVYGDIDHAGLRLITCGGQFDSGAASYDDNIVVYAARV